jgi:hypothetical protein
MTPIPEKAVYMSRPVYDPNPHCFVVEELMGREDWRRVRTRHNGEVAFSWPDLVLVIISFLVTLAQQ